MSDQLSLFDGELTPGTWVELPGRELSFDEITKRVGQNWIPEVDNNCRMWKCPKCSGRMIGEPMHWNPDFNPYHFCPYCGTPLETKKGKT